MCADDLNVAFHATYQTNVHRNLVGHVSHFFVELKQNHENSDVNVANGLDQRYPNFTAPVAGTYFIAACALDERFDQNAGDAYTVGNPDTPDLPLELIKRGVVSPGDVVVGEGVDFVYTYVELQQGETVHLQPELDESNGLTNVDNQVLRRHKFDIHFDGFLVKQ